MNAMNILVLRESHELVFRSVSSDERTYVFPCDAQGQVQLDRLSEGARNDYFYARVVAGNALSPPFIRAALQCSETRLPPQGSPRLRALFLSPSQLQTHCV